MRKLKLYKFVSLQLLILVLVMSCTEIYNPEIKSDTKALVVEGLITDGEGPFAIKLTETVPYTADMTTEIMPVRGARLIVSDTLNLAYVLSETAAGIYTLPANFVARTGNSYKLRIETSDGNIFESSTEKLNPPLKYDSIHSFFSTNKFIDKNNNVRNVNGADVRVDLFGDIVGVKKPLCRFKTDVTVQYSFTYNLPDTIAWHYFCFGWESFVLNSTENLTDEKAVSGSQTIKNHSLGFVPYETSTYGFNMPDSANVSYYLRINQYTMNQNSFKFYQDANSQLAASGKIFDPVASQLTGNMKCINNPSKIVLGLFEVSSVSKSAYVIDIVNVSRSVFLFKVPYVDFNQTSVFRYRVWDLDPKGKPQDDEAYTEIPFTNWWFHN